MQLTSAVEGQRFGEIEKLRLDGTDRAHGVCADHTELSRRDSRDAVLPSFDGRPYG